MLYVGGLVACMLLSGWAGTYEAWRWLAGEQVGTSLAVFWDLQVESYVNVLLLVAALDIVYGMHRTDDGGWGFVPRGPRTHVAFYVALAVLAVVCSAEGPLRATLQVPLPDDIGASVAHYFRRALEAVLATLGVMVFLDVVRPGGFASR
jgi:small basic protein